MARSECDEATVRAEPLTYPYAAAAKLKSKYSVTELNKAPDDEAPVFFMAGGAGESDEDAGLTAKERGTALHKAMELLDFREAYAHRSDREHFGDGSRDGSFYVQKEPSPVAEALYRFANSDLLARAAAAGFLIKEAPFNMKMPFGETIRGRDSGDAASEDIVVQGVIDLLFSENEGLVIVDYKTGWFDASD